MPRLFDRVLIPPAVLKEMSAPQTPEAVRRWAAAPPDWLEVKEPSHIEDIPSLGKTGQTGAGEKAAIALALEERADVLIMDDKRGRKEAVKRGLQPVWMLTVLDEAAERGLINDLTKTLEHLEHKTPFSIGRVCREAMTSMKQRDQERSHARPQARENDQEQG